LKLDTDKAGEYGESMKPIINAVYISVHDMNRAIALYIELYQKKIM